jgi:geranylgeranylglycerol-phosphate geranylgeranyltransferase
MIKTRVVNPLIGFVLVTRLDNSFEAAAYTLLGAYLGSSLAQTLSSRSLCAALVVGLIVAYGFVINDYWDVEVDRLSKPDRPIPSGRVSRRAAGMVAALLTITALMVALSLGPAMAWMAGFTILLATLYSYYLKATVLLGNAAMALLDASIVIYGGLSVENLVPAIWVISILTFLYAFAQEILYTVADREGDARAGLRTTAAALGPNRAIDLFRLFALGFVITAIVPWFLGIAPNRYLYTVLPCSVLPMLGIIIVISPRTSEPTIRRSLGIMKLIWFSSLLPVVLLK